MEQIVISATALTILTVLYWFIYGKDEKIIPSVTFKPPKNKNAAEIGAIYSEKAGVKEIVALILYLATKGYLKIKFYDSAFVIVKLKEYKGFNLTEKLLMDAIFKKPGEKGCNYVIRDELSCSFFDYMDIIKHLNHVKDMVYYDETASFSRKIIPLTVVFSFLVMLFWILYLDNASLFIFSLLGAFSPFLSLLKSNSLDLRGMNLSSVIILLKISLFLFLAVFIIVTCTTQGVIENFIQYHKLLLYILFCLIISSICLYNMPKKNKSGRKLVGEILGFKKYIHLVEKNNIKFYAKNNSNYCSDILPYAYALDEAQDWLKNFEGESLEFSWFDGVFSSRTLFDFEDYIKFTDE